MSRDCYLPTMIASTKEDEGLQYHSEMSTNGRENHPMQVAGRP